MKSVIIYGAARSGKSTLAARISKELGYNWVPIDALRESYKIMILPEKMPKGNAVRSKIISPAIVKFLEILEYSSRQTGQHFVVEGNTLNMEFLVSRIDKEKFVILCMAYPDMTPEEKYNELIKYENENDWTQGRPRDEIRKMCEGLIKESKDAQDDAKKLGLKFIDTKNREKAFDDAILYIKENMI